MKGKQFLAPVGYGEVVESDVDCLAGQGLHDPGTVLGAAAPLRRDEARQVAAARLQAQEVGRLTLGLLACRNCRNT